MPRTKLGVTWSTKRRVPSARAVRAIDPITVTPEDGDDPVLEPHPVEPDGELARPSQRG
jgi:hypothetical protein